MGAGVCRDVLCILIYRFNGCTYENCLLIRGFVHACVFLGVGRFCDVVGRRDVSESLAEGTHRMTSALLVDLPPFPPI